MQLIKLWLACLVVVLLNGCCVTTGIEIVDLGCFWASPMRVSDGDVLTDQTADQMRAHNEAWVSECD